MPWGIVGIIAASAALLGGSFWWWWPKRQVGHLRLTIRDPKARADVEDNFRKTIGQLLGGAAVLFGAWLAYLQFSQQQQVVQEQFSRQQQASHELLVSNQLGKGFEQLGNDKLVVRLGGIYALEGVMNTSQEYHQVILEALAAFVRDSTSAKTGDEPPATDIQAVLTVLGRRASIGTGSPDLAHAHVPKAYLSNANLSRAYLSDIDLREANLSGADLSGADLSGADLSAANLSDVNLTHDTSTGWGAFVRFGPATNLTGAILFTANLSGAQLHKANLSLANLGGANLSKAILDEANLNRASLFNADLREAHFSAADLTGANLSGSNLNRATVSQTQLDNACGSNLMVNSRFIQLRQCTRREPH